MKLSYKATQFIIEAIDFQIEAYQKRLEEIEDADDDEASDIGNDCGFLEALRNDLLESLKEVKLSEGRGNTPSKQELTKLIRELSINDRLLLVDAINESIREEISGVKTAISSRGKRGSWEEVQRVLTKVPDVKPEESDRLY